VSGQRDRLSKGWCGVSKARSGQRGVGVKTTNTVGCYIVAVLIGRQEFSHKETTLTRAMASANTAALELGCRVYDLDGKDIKAVEGGVA